MNPILRQLCYTALQPLGFARHRRPQPRSYDKVLVANLGLIGDGLLVTPFLRAMRQALPNSQIDVLVTPAGSVALRRNPNIDQQILYDAFWADPIRTRRTSPGWRHASHSLQVIRRLRQEHYNIVVNTWFADQPLAAALLRLIRAECLCGFGFANSRRMNDVNVSFDVEQSVVNNLLTLLYRILNVARPDAREWPIEFHDESATLPPVVPKSYIVIAPFSSERAKTWHSQHWYKVIRWLNVAYPEYAIVLTGARESAAEAEEYSRTSHLRLRNLVGKSSFQEFASIVKHAHLVVAVDSSVTHLASAFRTPIFILYSQVYNFRQLLPFGTAFAYMAEAVECAAGLSECSRAKCMDHSPEHVIERLASFMEALL